MELKNHKELGNNEKLENDGELGSSGGLFYCLKNNMSQQRSHGICGGVWRRPLTLVIQRLGGISSKVEAGDFWEPYEKPLSF